MFRAQLVLLLGLSKAWATHEASAGFGAARPHAMRNPPASAAPDVERVQSVEMEVLPGDRTLAIDEFVRARAETIRYHEALYRSTSLGTRGSWLAHPHPLVMDSLDLVTHPVHASRPRIRPRSRRGATHPADRRRAAHGLSLIHI